MLKWIYTEEAFSATKRFVLNPHVFSIKPNATGFNQWHSEVRKLIEVNKARVADMFLTEYDEQGVMDVIREDGFAEGEHMKAAEVAKAMLAKGIDVDTVSQCSGISVEDLKNLK